MSNRKEENEGTSSTTDLSSIEGLLLLRFLETVEGGCSSSIVKMLMRFLRRKFLLRAIASLADCCKIASFLLPRQPPSLPFRLDLDLRTRHSPHSTKPSRTVLAMDHDRQEDARVFPLYPLLAVDRSSEAYQQNVKDWTEVLKRYQEGLAWCASQGAAHYEDRHKQRGLLLGTFIALLEKLTSSPR